MSNPTQTASTKGIRYTDDQKKEVVDFAVNYNAENGRGGQSKAAEKFNISQLTVAAWLKAAGASSGKKGKAAKAPKAPKAEKKVKAAKGKKAGVSARSSRYTDEQKQEVVDFVTAYNEANGRGGASTASKKFGVAPLSINAWLKAAGATSPRNKKGAAKKADRKVAAGKVSKSSSKVGSDLNSKLAALLDLSKQIDKAESELDSLKAKFASLKSSL